MTSWLLPLAIAAVMLNKSNYIINYGEFLKLNALLDINSYTVILDTLIHNMSLLTY